ncbi:hypothetical protein GOBAR_AA19481 [Gossypium barbadense]|uniref:RNA helicase n=1 Tax=Gossypium barbadense TaxID=3634 RepID=A0A2P5XCY1_GOSBA|nr:hypothetical protein GOBAR_AA19481 [Gossypium barbadense]
MKASTSVKHIVLPCSKSARSQLIPDIIHCYSSSGRTIIFIETKDSASELAGLLPGSRALHGDIQQAQREVTLNGFRSGKFMTLVATNVAARGLDINDVQLIIQVRTPCEVLLPIIKAREMKLQLNQQKKYLQLRLEKFDLQGKVEDSDILSHVGKLRKEFKSTLKTRYYKEMVQGGRSTEEIYENNPHGVHDDQWKWLVDDEEYCKLRHNQESRTKVGYAHTSGSTGYATLNTQFDEACKMVKDSMPTPKSSFAPQDNIALENEVYTQMFGLDNDGKMLGYGRGMTKSRLFGYGSVTRGSQSTSAITEQVVREKTLLEEAESRFHTEAVEQEACLIAEVEERFMRLTEIREAKFMDMMDAREKMYKALTNECMAKGMSSKYKVFHSKHSKVTIL